MWGYAYGLLAHAAMLTCIWFGFHERVAGARHLLYVIIAVDFTLGLIYICSVTLSDNMYEPSTSILRRTLWWYIRLAKIVSILSLIWIGAFFSAILVFLALVFALVANSMLTARYEAAQAKAATP